MGYQGSTQYGNWAVMLRDSYTAMQGNGQRGSGEVKLWKGGAFITVKCWIREAVRQCS
jgi:hypothetical protein